MRTVALSSESLDLQSLLLRLSRRNSLERIAIGVKGICMAGTLALAGLLIYELAAGALTDRTALGDIERAISEAKGDGAPTSEAQTKPPAPPSDLALIASRNIFGPFTVRQAPTTTAPASKPVPVIPLDLIGTFISDGTTPYAIIEDRNKKNQEIFMVQDMIFGSAKLLAIRPDSVEIERNGQRETLTIDLLSKRGSETGAGGGENEFVVAEADVDQALSNLPLLLTQARAVPYFKDGQAIGLRMFAIRSGSLFEKIGIRNGDILKSINGSNLGDLSQAMKLFERLKTERNLVLTLERDRQDKEFKYSIR